MFDAFVRKASGSGLIFYNLLNCRRISNASEDKLQAVQSCRLRALVRFAAKEVPYYQTLFRREGIDPDSIKSAEDLEKLPLLDKETVRRAPKMFQPASKGSYKTLDLLTSGSTGQPVSIKHDYFSLLANVAFGERERRVILALLQPKGFDFSELSIVYPSSTLLKVRQFYSENTFLYLGKRRLTVSVLEPIERICDEINRVRPDVVVSYGSFFEFFFKLISLRRISLAFPKVLVYAGDDMTTESKLFIETSFGIPVISFYNAVEAFKIGYTCELRRGFHIHDDICHLRIVDQNGGTLPHSEMGEIVLSNLLNRGTVLLNYRIGDRGALIENNCPCGRRGLLLDELQGRVEDLILLPGGEVVHPRAIWGVFKNCSEILQYQLVQHDLDRHELTLVTADEDVFDRVLPEFLTKLHRLLGPSASIEAAFGNEVKKDGKFRPVISHVKNRELR